MKLQSTFTKTVLVALLSIGPLAVTSLHAANHFVSMTESWTFVPNYLEIEVGDTVTWVNTEDESFGDFHDATSDILVVPAWTTGSIDPGESSSPILFSSPGNYPYRDSLIPSMTGTIVVNAAPELPGASGLTDPQWMPDGAFRFTITNLTAGLETVIASSTNLTDWTEISTNYPDSDSMSYTNPPSPGTMAEYFRCWQIP